LAAAAATAADDAGKENLSVTPASTMSAAGVAAAGHLAGLRHLVGRLDAAVDAVAQWLVAWTVGCLPSLTARGG